MKNLILLLIPILLVGCGAYTSPANNNVPPLDQKIDHVSDLNSQLETCKKLGKCAVLTSIII